MHLTPNQQAADKNTPPEQLRMLAKQSLEILRLIAQNPKADPELLRELADISRFRYITLRKPSVYNTICEAVASNPNTPTDVLLSLGAEFPDQLLDNPVFSLLLLENPNLFYEMP